MGCAHDYKGFRKWIRLNLSFFFHNHLITLGNTFMNPWNVFKKKWRLRGEKLELLHEVSSRVTLNSTHPSLQHVHSTQGPFLFSPKNSSLPHITSTQIWHFLTSLQNESGTSKSQLHTSLPHQKTLKNACRGYLSKWRVEVTCQSDVSRWRVEVTCRSDVWKWRIFLALTDLCGTEGF